MFLILLFMVWGMGGGDRYCRIVEVVEVCFEWWGVFCTRMEDIAQEVGIA